MENLVILREHSVENVKETDYPGTYDGESNEWSHRKFKEKFKIQIISLDKLEIEFDLIGLHAAIANSLRRILLTEVPSMAIEKVFISNNTTLIKDEVLAHRLGLVPLRANPNLFEFKRDGCEDASEQDTLEYELKIKCTVNTDGLKSSQHINDMYKNHTVYSKHIKWVPIGGQAVIYKEKEVKPVHGDIILNKLRPGQELDIKLHAVKGLGKDHAKFSPVATAYYRLMPEIQLLRNVVGDQAELLQKCFSPGVIELEDTPDGSKQAVVKNARYDSCSRNVFRYDDLKDSVKIGCVRDHFIFHIESVGAQTPDVLFVEAVKVLKQKCVQYLDELNSSCS